MLEYKVKLTGQTVNDPKPVLLNIGSPFQIMTEAKEYMEVFPDIVLLAEWGYFPKYISAAEKVEKELKAKAFGRLFSALMGPVNNVVNQLKNK